MKTQKLFTAPGGSDEKECVALEPFLLLGSSSETSCFRRNFKVSLEC